MKTQIHAEQLRKMIQVGASRLTENKELVDRLNVFPVPDGDTGTNMSMTIASAIKELDALEEAASLEQIGKAITRGSLMGARGNSGVILSQILRGFSDGLKNKTTLNIEEYAKALDTAREVAYKAVIKPVEGTILTVIKDTAQHALQVYPRFRDIGDFLEEVVSAAQKSLDATPTLLKALADANVVDSGGKGLVFFLEGMWQGYLGKPVLEPSASASASAPTSLTFENFEDLHVFDGELQFGYCTEFMVKDPDIDPKGLEKEIESFGDSLIVVGDEDLIKIHIHTNNPGQVMEQALLHGMLDKMKIENMRLQHQAVLKRQNDASKKAVPAIQSRALSVVAVAIGEGICRIMRDLGADQLIEGGQTMNPSTQDFLDAIERCSCDEVILLPNNSNIIMAANQAAELSTDKKVQVVSSKSIPQGIAALVSADVQGELQENCLRMEQARKQVSSGQVTFSVRDTVSEDLVIHKDDKIGLYEKQIVAAGGEVAQVAEQVIAKMVNEDTEIITLYYGEDVQESEAKALQQKLAPLYPDAEVELFEGGQPLYYYLLSAE